MAVIQYADLPIVRDQFRDKKIVFCSGVFDLTHAGHVLFFEDAGKLGDVLVVAVGGDAIIQKYKGVSRPIIPELLRLKMVDALKPVDYCFMDKTTSDADPLSIIDLTFLKLHPDIYVVNSDAFNLAYRKKRAEECNVELVVLERWYPPEYDGISTSKIIEKIKKMEE